MKTKGFTIIELLFVILIIAFLIYGYASLHRSNASNTVIDELAYDVLQIKNNIIESYMAEISYEGLTEERAVALGLFPPDITLDANGKCTLRVGSKRCKINILSTAGVRPDYIPENAGFQIIFRNLPNKYCLPLMNELYEHFEYLAFPSTHVLKSHEITYNHTNTREYCMGLDQEQSSNLRVAHY